MSWCILAVLVCVYLSCPYTHAVRHGYAPDWVLQRYCAGKAGQMVKLPWRCDGYLKCYQPSGGAWFKCVGTYKFNEQISTCVPVSTGCDNLAALAARLCSEDPTLKFPHPSSCAMYYDCSQTQKLDQYNLGVYENECPHPQLFDPDTGACSTQSPSQIICENKPGTKCDYRKECISTPNLCSGKFDGNHQKPGTFPFWTDYITCVEGVLMASGKCAAGSVFDPIVRSCSSNISASLRSYCAMNPQAVFPDSRSCSRYYRCSMTTPYPDPDLKLYEDECIYRFLFDITTMSCVLHSDLQTPCGSRFEPIDPCEYKIGHCFGRAYCILCPAKCKGKVDGPHPYPDYPNTRYHIMCKGGRLLNVLSCPEKQIYFPAHKRCLVEGSTHIIGQTTLPPAPTTPQIQTDPPVPVTTPPVPTVPPVQMTTPPVEQRVTDPSTDTCGCMGEISPMITSLTNLSHFVDEMYTDMQVPSPYHCDQPPLIINGNVEVFYRGNEAVASYSCVKGFELCGDVSEIPCNGDIVWSEASLGQCVKNEWFNINAVELPCQVRSYSEIEFRGRAVEDMFTFLFYKRGNGQEFVNVIVKIDENTILGGESNTQRKTVKSPIPLVGLLTWRIRLEVWRGAHTTEIYVNDVFVMDFKRFSQISGDALAIEPGFRTEYIKVKYNGQEESPRIRHLSSNLAHLKPVFASSHEGSSDANRITDGFAYRDWIYASCWSVEPDDPQPWLLIDLRKEFYVSYLVFSTLECVGETCPKGVGEFEVTLSTTDPREGEIQKTICQQASNEYLPSSSQTLTCQRGVTGRFVYIDFKGPYDKQTTICEVEVYGGVASNSEWSPFSCPDPPIVEGASLTLSYTHNEAIATYMCDESYVRCSGNDVIRCQDETGWYDSPGVCTKAVYEATNGVAVAMMHICPLRLGSALEMWLTFTDGYEMGFFQGSFLMLQIEGNGLNTKIAHDTFGDNSVNENLPPIVRDKEIHLVFYSLSNHFLIKIDDEVYYESQKDHFYFDHDIIIHHMNTVVRKAVYHPSVMKAFNREVLDYDLAVGESGRYVTSTFSSDHRVYHAVDTMLESCWIAKPTDTSQFLLLDLGIEFFIREVHVLPRLVSGDDVNLALGKTATGSANVDGNSDASHVVDGVLKTLPSQGSCFSSSTVDAWWMVDLGEKVTVSSVAIQTRTDGNAEHHSQIAVTVYELNPFGSVETADLLCFEYNSTLPPFKRISCESPKDGQFVKIKKMVGATSSALTLCEVEIYSEPEGHQYDFSVDIFSTSTERGNGKRCGSHAGEFPSGPIILACDEHTAGTYVMIQKDKIAENDQMNICDIKVYGDKVVEKVRSSEECGLPPLVANAYTNVSYSLLKAKATYTCFDGYYSCRGPTTIHCSDRTTWDETTVVCKRESDDVLEGVSDVSFCPLNIGDTIEFFFTPTDLTFEIDIKWLKMISGPTGLNMAASWSVTISPNPFTVDKETRVVITVFGDHLYVDIDGAIFRRRGYGLSADIHEIKTKLGKLRRYSIKRWNEDIIEFRSFDVNQALGKYVYVSTTMVDMEKESVVDGNLEYHFESLKCWSVDNGDSRQFFSIYLGNDMYITHVTLTSPSCKVCEDQHGLHNFRIDTFYDEPEDLCYDYHGTFPPSSTKTIYCTNVQYGDGVTIKQTNTNVLLSICEVQVFGGYLYNKESKRNLALFGATRARWSTTGFASRLAVDGVKSISMDSKSCYKSKESISEPWWSVAFGDIYLIHQVAITTAESCQGTCEAKDFIIQVGVDDDTALCLEYKGTLPSEETTILTCNKRIPGKILKITMNGREKTQILCEVEVYGDRITYEAETDVNLAENRPVFASSGVSDRGLVVDGNLNGGPIFCWTSEIGDEIPWLYVELDTFYLVSKIEITNKQDCGEPCNTRLRSFLIDGFIERPTLESVGQLCTEQFPPIAIDTSVMLECTKPVISRYVRFFANKRTDVIHLCELKVFGRKAILTGGWSPSKCPAPPALPHACVDVCYHDGVAVATYTCDTNYAMCTGSNTLTCSSEAGWEGSPGVCVQTTMEVNPGLNNQVLGVQVCHPKLGEGFELWVTPRQNGCTLEFLNDNKETTAAKITYYPGDVMVEFQYDGEDNIKAFSLNQESHLTLVYTSKGLAITVDGKLLSYPPHVPLSTQIGYIRALGFVIRKLRALPRYSKYLQRVAREDNLVASNSFGSSAKSSLSNVYDKDVTQTLAKCWQPNSGNTDQWVAVKLDEFAFVRAVVLYMTSTACQCEDDRTHNFRITVHPTTNLDDRAMTCAFYEGVLPLGAVERVACKKDVWGRYVRIMKDAAYVQSSTDLLTFCEIEVYGDVIIRKEWSPDDCPPPPDYPNAYAQIFKSSQESLAMYACKEDFTMCGNSGQNKLTCNSDKGWEGQIAKCVQTSRELPFGAEQDLEEFWICPFALGHALKIWFTSTGDSWRQLALTVGGSKQTHVSVILDPDRVELSTKINGERSSVTNIQDNFLTLGKEAILTVYFVSQILWVSIDGVLVDTYAHTIPPPSINHVLSQPDIKIRKMMQVQELPPEIITDSGEIRASGSVLRVSSTEVNYSKDFIFDGIPGTATKCWISQPEVDQWLLLDMGAYAFVKSVDIFGKRENLALSKNAAGSTNYDDKSDALATVNGDYGNTRLDGDCYTSTANDAKNMLVVDLGKEYTIEAVAVQGRADPSHPDQADDLVVNLYSTDPLTDTSATPKSCMSFVGRPEPFAVYPCDSPVKGRFVAFSRPGASQLLTLCEVEVFAKRATLGENIKVEVFKVDPGTPNNQNLCGIYEIDKSMNPYESIFCKEGIWGRYIFISRTASGEQGDVMSICDVRVIGETFNPPPL